MKSLDAPAHAAFEVPVQVLEVPTSDQAEGRRVEGALACRLATELKHAPAAVGVRNEGQAAVGSLHDVTQRRVELSLAAPSPKEPSICGFKPAILERRVRR